MFISVILNEIRKLFTKKSYLANFQEFPRLSVYPNDNCAYW